MRPGGAVGRRTRRHEEYLCLACWPLWPPAHAWSSGSVAAEGLPLFEQAIGLGFT